MTAIKAKEVLSVLQRRFSGAVRRTGRQDAAGKLHDAMSLHSQLTELRELLAKMAKEGKIEVECRGNHFDLIALPQTASKPAEPKDKEGDSTVPTPKGARMTTRARDSQGNELPATLHDEQVSPVVTRYRDAEAGENIAAAAGLVLDELRSSGKTRLSRDEVYLVITAVLEQLYEPEAVKALATPVFNHFVDNKYLRRDPRPNPKVLYEIKPPEQPATRQPESSAEMLAQVVAAAEDLQEKNQKLEAELERIKQTFVSPDVLERAVSRLESATAENTALRQKLKAAHEELARSRRSHNEQIAKLEADLKEVRRAKAALEERLEQGISPDLQARLRNLGIK